MYTESLPTNNPGSDDIYDDVASTEHEQEVRNFAFVTIRIVHLPTNQESPICQDFIIKHYVLCTCFQHAEKS